ncbi:unnamed protein product, partial [marine sediment metagenome]
WGLKLLMGTRDAQQDENVTPIFGLSEVRLRPIVERIAREPVASFTVTIDHKVEGHRGYSAEKLIPTFHYPTKSGPTRSTTVFVKWFHQPGLHEAHHYANLEKQHAPIPRMYGTLTDTDQREMIFLEYLDPIDDLHPFHRFQNGTEGFLQFLGLAARFNAVQLEGEYASRLPRRDIARDLQGVGSVLDRIWDSALKGDLGNPIKKLCSSSRDKLPSLKVLADSVVDPIGKMELGLGHNDFYPDSAAWRRETRELLALDLESVGFAPRFYDVARWVGAPDDVQTRCLPRQELAEHYLQEYARWGGTPVPIDEFLKDTQILWMAQALTMLGWRLRRAQDGRVDWTDDREEGRRVFRDDLHRQLSILLGEVS